MLSVPPVAAVADEAAQRLWSSCEAASEAWLGLRTLELPGYDASVRDRVFNPAQWQGALDAATSEQPLEPGARLAPVLGQLGAGSAACDAMRAGTLAGQDELDSLLALTKSGNLGFLSQATRKLSGSPLSAELVREALQFRPDEGTATPTLPGLPTVDAGVQLARTLLDHAQRTLVQMALDELLGRLSCLGRETCSRTAQWWRSSRIPPRCVMPTRNCHNCDVAAVPRLLVPQDPEATSRRTRTCPRHSPPVRFARDSLQ